MQRMWPALVARSASVTGLTFVRRRVNWCVCTRCFLQAKDQIKSKEAKAKVRLQARAGEWDLGFLRVHHHGLCAAVAVLRRCCRRGQ